MSTKNILIIISLVVILIVGISGQVIKSEKVQKNGMSLSVPTSTENFNKNSGFFVAELGGVRLNLLIATTTEAKERGLSGMKSLLPDQAMLFVFETPVREGFWMKEMNFPIDIIWFDQNKKIVDVWENADPNSYPKIYYPRANSSFVLETNANFFKDHNLKIGDSINFI